MTNALMSADVHEPKGHRSSRHQDIARAAAFHGHYINGGTSLSFIFIIIFSFKSTWFGSPSVKPSPFNSLDKSRCLTKICCEGKVNNGKYQSYLVRIRKRKKKSKKKKRKVCRQFVALAGHQIGWTLSEQLWSVSVIFFTSKKPAFRIHPGVLDSDVKSSKLHRPSICCCVSAISLILLQ